ncbi:MAG: hypothetical protein WEA99_00585 [Brumimicrobium sp.]
MELSNNEKKLKTVTAWRAFFASIPYVGGAIIELGFEHRARVKNERVFAFADELKQYFDKINQEQVNQEFINSNRFTDIFEDIISLVAKTDDAQKRNRFKELLIGTTIPNSKVDQFEIFLELTSKLHENQIILLKKFYQAKSAIQQLEKDVFDLNNELQSSMSHEKRLKRKAEDGSIKPSESIAKQIENSRNIEKNRILKENEVKKLMSVSRNDLVGESEDNINIFIDDLLAKRLLLDVSQLEHGEKSNSYGRMVISPLGYHYINFLKGNSKN